MANHCMDVICADCGAQWCERGCGSKFAPDEASKQRIQLKIIDNKAHKVERARCPFCKEANVYHD